MKLNYLALTQVEKPAEFAGMTYPMYRPSFERPHFHQMAVGTVVLSDDGPVGLGLGARTVQGEPASVISVFVQPNARRQGIGSELLRRTTEQLQQVGEPLIYGRFPATHPSTPHVQRMLERQGWCEPYTHIHLFRTDPESVAKVTRTPGLRPSPLPTGYTLTPWLEHTEEDRRQALKILAEPEMPHGLTPFLDDYPHQPAGSMVLRRDGQLVGWTSTHQISPDVVRYTCVYVWPPARLPGLGSFLFGESLRRAAIGPPVPTGIVCGVLPGTPMAEFLRRRFAMCKATLAETTNMESYKGFY